MSCTIFRIKKTHQWIEILTKAEKNPIMEEFFDIFPKMIFSQKFGSIIFLSL